MGAYIKTNENATVQAILEVVLIKEGDYIVSYCSALELSSYGETEEEAKEGFEGALETFFKETHERGTLERILLDLGWSLRKRPVAEYKPPITTKRNPLMINSFTERVAIPV